jgi:hypothetical protein
MDEFVCTRLSVFVWRSQDSTLIGNCREHRVLPEILDGTALSCIPSKAVLSLLRTTLPHPPMPPSSDSRECPKTEQNSTHKTPPKENSTHKIPPIKLHPQNSTQENCTHTKLHPSTHKIPLHPQNSTQTRLDSFGGSCGGDLTFQSYA